VEIVGLIGLTGMAYTLSTILGVLAWFFRRTRPFSFSLWVTPPVALASLILSRWFFLDHSHCGQNPDWDRCPTTLASSIGWAGWLLFVVVTAVAAFAAQRATTSYVNQHLDEKLKQVPTDSSTESTARPQT